MLVRVESSCWWPQLSFSVFIFSTPQATVQDLFWLFGLWTQLTLTFWLIFQAESNQWPLIMQFSIPISLIINLNFYHCNFVLKMVTTWNSSIIFQNQYFFNILKYFTIQSHQRLRNWLEKANLWIFQKKDWNTYQPGIFGRILCLKICESSQTFCGTDI